jgi:hypothetical protein
VRVPAKTVFSSIQGCAIETVAEYRNPATDTWEVVRQTTRSNLDLTADRMLVDFTCG